jgi:DNA-binding LacI/PurR family transcriptional regulator
VAGQDKAGAVGLVLARPARLLGAEPYFMEFIAGIEERLTERGLSVLLHVVATHDAEIAAYRRWAEHHLVDAVLLVNRTADDPRLAVLREVGLPTVVVGEPSPELAMPAVRSDDAGAMEEALAHLLELGHRHIARISGPRALLHTRARSAALLAGCHAAGVEPVVLEGDYSEESGAKLTAALLTREQRPTAILYDNDVMAVAGLNAAKEFGVAVPAELSLVAWDDSTLCRLASPALTTMSVDVHQVGTSVAESVLELIDGAAVAERWSPAAALVQRGTSAPAPTR